MFPTNLGRGLEISKLCQDVLAANPQLFFVALVNKNGGVIESKFCNDGWITDLSSQEKEMFFMQRSLQIALGREFDEKIGHLDHIMIERKDFLEFLFPCGKDLIFLVTEKEIVSRSLLKKFL